MSSFDWEIGKSFTCDWTTRNFPAWNLLLAVYQPHATRVLEIGSWEGRSALYFLNRLPRATVTCVDTWEGSVEHKPQYVVGIEQRFDANLSTFNGRVEKIKARSHVALKTLTTSGFDIAYIDGSHKADDVHEDAMLAWPLLNPGGIMIFDDYAWTGMPDEVDRPRLGIDRFLTDIAGKHVEVLRGYQIAIVKMGE